MRLLVYVALTAAACAAPKSTGSSASCIGEPVAEIPPDTVPAWFQDDSSYSGVYMKHIIAVRFHSTATAAERQGAIASVCGRVVGGWRLTRPGEGLYAVQVADSGDQRRMDELLDRIRAQPVVATATQNPALRITPH